MKAALTPREQQVLVYLSRGRSLARMASEMGVAVQTVDTHLTHIAEKLGMGRRELRVRVIEERVRLELAS